MASASFRSSLFKRALLVALGLPFLLGSLQCVAGEFTATTSGMAPTENVIESIAGESIGDFRWFSLPQSDKPHTERNFAQTFRASGNAATLLHGVAIQVASIDKAVGDGARNAMVKVAIYEGDTPAVATTTEPLYTTTGRLPKTIGSGDYITLQFGQSVELSAGRSYSLVFAFETPAAEQWINLSAGGTSSYASGQAYFLSNEQAGAAPAWKMSQCDAKLLLLSAP